MSSQLKEKDLQLLDANSQISVGQKPYENGKWGAQGLKDFVHFQLFDDNKNLLQFKNLPLTEFMVNSGNIEFYPGKHIRDLGYQSGTFNVKYNFLRKLAGEESAVLVHTLNTSTTKRGDVYTNMEAVYVTDDALVFAATEVDYKSAPSSTEQLGVEDLKYQIDLISPSRTEVRLRAKNINGSYKDDFLDIQTAIKKWDLDQTIEFVGDLYDSIELKIQPQGFIFTEKMIGATVTINDVYKVDEVTDYPKTGINFFKNGNFDDLWINNLGEIIMQGDKWAWDESLHDDAVRATDWQPGFQRYDDPKYSTAPFYGTQTIGYHAKVVMGEGNGGGNCIKFIDQNEGFIDLPVWPNEQRYRGLQISQHMQELSRNGISRGDIINISLDVKSTVANKGVKIEVRYPDRYEGEVEPEGSPAGYYNPVLNPPTEAIPENPPAEYQPPGSAEEAEPPYSVTDIMNVYPDAALATVLNLQVGDTTTSLGGDGDWKIMEIEYGSGGPEATFDAGRINKVFTWVENINLAIDTLSPDGQWRWNGDAWVTTPEYSNAPVPGDYTVNNINTVNHHPFQTPGQGTAYFPRTSRPGENAGWQTGTTYGSSTDEKNQKALLFKDDLVWRTRYDGDEDDLRSYNIEEWSNSTVFRTTTVLGEDSRARTLYEDIFENGFIQSVTRAREVNTNPEQNVVRGGHYIIFYNDGRGNYDTSNKYFQIKTGSPLLWIGDSNTSNVFQLTDISDVLNAVVNNNSCKLEVSFHRGLGIPSAENREANWYYYFVVGSETHIMRDINGNISSGANILNNPNGDIAKDFPMETAEWFPHFMNNDPDVLFPVNAIDNVGAGNGDWSKAHAIFEENITKANINSSGLLEDAEWSRSVEGRFEGAGTKTKRFSTSDLGDVTYGVRNPSADNYGVHDEEGTVVDSDTEPLYDNGTAIFSYDTNPTKDGTMSPEEGWRWDGQNAVWVTVQMVPPRYHYVVHPWTREFVSPDAAGDWQRFDIQIPIPDDWMLQAGWILYIKGDGQSTNHMQQGIVWVDNLFMDFTLTQQAITKEVFSPFYAQIANIISPSQIKVDQSIRELADIVGAQDSDLDGVGDGNPDIYNVTDSSTFSSFSVSYTNFNPKDLRTYLKFDNDLFLTTNFKPDRIGVTNFPYSIVYKLYEPLPKSYEKYDECIVVKEMANPLEEKIKIIDFVPKEDPTLVLRSPDLHNVESPVQRRSTQYKTESDILTSDKTISNELRNEFLSQSLDSVKINTDYSRYEKFINFSSVETRIRNFRRKLEDIESLKISSASYIGVSGSIKDQNLYHFKIEDEKNNFDDFEKYMYQKSSSYASSSLGIFYDNAWPKASGVGTLNNPYVLAHTTSSQANTWFTNAKESASLYDDNNLSKLSTILPEHIKVDTKNQDYIKFTDMIGHHFDHIWEYINALSDTYDRRDKLDEGISKDLLWSVAKSLGWNLNDGKDLISLPRFAVGKEVTGSAYSDYSAISERDASREIWSRIINNMPFFLKNKGTVKALKGLINIYGIPSTILRVKEYGGPDLPDNASPQYEITRKFTKALDFRGSQYVRVAWTDDSDSGRKPDTVELRFRAATGSNQILVEKQDDNNQDWFIRLKDNDSTDNYGTVSFMLSGSKVGVDQGQYKEISSSALPIYDGDFYSVMVRRMIGSDDTSVSQSYELNVGKYDSSRSKMHLYSTTTMDVTQAASSSFSNAWTGSGDIYIGGSADIANAGVQFSGSIMEYRHWTEVLNTGSFKNHVRNPKAYNGNTVSSSYNNLVLRYPMNDNKDLSSDTGGVRDISSNQNTTLSGSHSGFTGNFFRNVVDEQKTHIPSIGALRRSTNKIRIESNQLKSGYQLNSKHRATDSAFDTAPNDSNRVGIWFAPTDVINNDIIESVGDLNFDNYLGDPRDRLKLSYNGLNYVADNYWKKYTAPNNFWDYMRLIKYYDQSMYPQLRKMIPARAKPDIGLLIEPNIFERPKVILGRTPDLENTYYSSSINIGKAVDGLIVITGSYNHGSSITNYEAYTGRIDMYSYETGSSVVSASGEQLLKEASGSEVRDRILDRSIWQRLGEGDYSNVTMSFGDTLEGVKGGPQPSISGSRIYGVNQSQMQFYSSSLSASLGKAYSSSFRDTDSDNYSHLFQGLRNSFYVGVKNTGKTTPDKKPPIEVIISAPTRLVTTEEGDFSLTTGDGHVPDFKDGDDKDDKQLMMTFEEKRLKDIGKSKGLKGLTPTPQTDQDRKLEQKKLKLQKDVEEGKLVLENYADESPILLDFGLQEQNNEGEDDRSKNNEK